LTSYERSIRLEAAAPDQEGNCTGAATQPRGFKIEEDEWLAHCCSAQELRCLVGIREPVCQGSNRFATVRVQ
jgi:hypothetical protein